MFTPFVSLTISGKFCQALLMSWMRSGGGLDFRNLSCSPARFMASFGKRRKTILPLVLRVSATILQFSFDCYSGDQKTTRSRERSNSELPVKVDILEDGCLWRNKIFFFIENSCFFFWGGGMESFCFWPKNVWKIWRRTLWCSRKLSFFQHISIAKVESQFLFLVWQSWKSKYVGTIRCFQSW